jgi:hypothetical protein
MKIWSSPHGDMGDNCLGRFAAPRIGNGAVRIWLYAGNSEYPALLAALAAVKMRRVRTISRKDLSTELENPQRPYARHPSTSDDEMVPSAWRHAVDVIKGSDVQFGRVRIRPEAKFLVG